MKSTGKTIGSMQRKARVACREKPGQHAGKSRGGMQGKAGAAFSGSNYTIRYKAGG